MRGENGDKIKGRVAELLRLIHLEGRGDRYPYQLSGGQQQRVALARALAIEPTVLLLDEPLSALDAKIRVALRQEIRQIQRQLGITTVYVTHDQEEALELSDRIVVMSEGRVEQIGTPFEIYNFPATGFVASFVGTLNAVEATIVDPAAGRLTLGGHAIRTTSALDGAAGDTMMVALRPEMITLDGIDGEPVPNANRVPATIVDIAFLGSVVRVNTRVGDGTTVHVDTFNNPNLAVPPAGSPVMLSFPPEACLVLAGTRSARTRTLSPRRRRCCSRPGVDRRPRRDRPPRLRQGRHAARLPRDVERLGGALATRSGAGDRSTGSGSAVRDARVRPAGAASPMPAAGSSRRRCPGCAT